MKYKAILKLILCQVLFLMSCSTDSGNTSENVFLLTPEDLPLLTARTFEVEPSEEFVLRAEIVQDLRGKILQHPQNLDNYITASAAYLQEAGTTSDYGRYLPVVEQLTGIVLKYNPEHSLALEVQANCSMIKHQFSDALQKINRAIEINPSRSSALGLLCDANLELGNYNTAKEACDKMLALRPGLSAYARAAYLREIHGDLAGAIEATRLAVDAGVTGSESRSWSLYQLGSLYLEAGKKDTAAFIFRGILEEDQNYSYAYNGLGLVAMKKELFTQAISYFEKAYVFLPEHLYLENLATAYQALGDSVKVTKLVNRVIEELYEEEQNGWNVQLEFARVCADWQIKMSEGLERIEKESGNRPDNIDVLHAYAWLLYRSGDAQKALPVLNRALRLNTASSELYLHAEVIYSELGMTFKRQVSLADASSNSSQSY